MMLVSSAMGQWKTASWQQCQAKAAVLRQLLLHYKVQATLAAPECYVKLCHEAKQWSATEKRAGRKALQNFLKSTTAQAAQPRATAGAAMTAWHSSAGVASGPTYTINYYSTLATRAPIRKRHIARGNGFQVPQPCLLGKQLSTQQLDGFEGLVNAEVNAHQEQPANGRDASTPRSSSSSSGRSSLLQRSAQGFPQKSLPQVDTRSASCSAQKLCVASGESSSTTDMRGFCRKAMSKCSNNCLGRGRPACSAIAQTLQAQWERGSGKVFWIL